jgi:hypothetical protein
MSAEHFTKEQQCACVSPDAHSCIRRRYPAAYEDEAGDEFYSHEKCECCCHQEEDDDDV